MLLDHFSKTTARRAEIRKNRPDTFGCVVNELRANGGLASMGLAAVFCILASLIMMLRDDVVPFRPGQYVPYDIISRVEFSYADKDQLNKARVEARDHQPRVYQAKGDVWTPLEERLLSLPDQVAGQTLEQLPEWLRTRMDSGTLTLLQQYQLPERRPGYNESVRSFVKSMREAKLVIIPASQRAEEVRGNRSIELAGIGKIRAEQTYATENDADLSAKLSKFAERNFELMLQPKILAITVSNLQPTYSLDEFATAEAKNRAAESVASNAGETVYKENMVFVPKGLIDQRDWQLLRAENQQFINQGLGGAGYKSKVGIFGLCFMMTVMLSAYVAHFQPRIVRNHARGVAVIGLLLAMLLVAQIAGIGSGPIYLFGIAPTLLVAMILAIAYDKRFALGVASMHGILVTVGLDQSATFFLILWIGILSACFLMGDLRTRSKLIEVGGASAIAMIAATGAAGMINLDPLPYVATNCLYSGAAGLAAGFVILGILPFIEKSFRITTSMTLLELADASQPLLRRLSIEAPGTYNHSLQVATLAEAAAEAIRCNSLLCRVGSYYHDVGKINKADYFVENQQPGANRHINLTPSVSLLIIIGHVKDGIELAREYGLPTSIFPFIQQHHGTTLVEYFYHQACQKDALQQNPQPAETEYRYPGPKPKSREVAIVMLADAVESACRSMGEPTANRIEALVHELCMRRLLDGQLEESDLTMRDLSLIEKSMVKTLLGIYHGRIAYPSTQAVAQPAASIKTA